MSATIEVDADDVRVGDVIHRTRGRGLFTVAAKAPFDWDGVLFTATDGDQIIIADTNRVVVTRDGGAL